jgi:hypothetical protein
MIGGIAAHCSYSTACLAVTRLPKRQARVIRQGSHVLAIEHRSRMSALSLRSPLTVIWIALAFVAFRWIDISSVRSWLTLMVVAVVPPLMMLWLWNDAKPVLIGALTRRQARP